MAQAGTQGREESGEGKGQTGEAPKQRGRGRSRRETATVRARLHGDLRASAVEHLREEISVLLTETA
jgi:hypothetical protein